MKSNMRGIVRGGIVWVMSLAFVSVILTSCSDDKNVAGGSTEDAGIIANLDVAGLAQKGPFVKGSKVTVQGIDCKTFELTDEIFEGKVNSDKGDFEIEDISLKSSCALFAVTGVYRSEITGKKTSKELTLYALTDLKDRKNVNINILTNLEYERLMCLVTEKGKKFSEAKEQAEKEVLAAFDIKGDFVEFENLNIFESGDENAALLAVSVMMQAETDDAGLVTRMEKFADSFAETGKWKDSTTKNAISEWAIEATANGGLDSIRKNVEAWDLGDTVPAFEKFIEAYADGDSVVLIVTPKSSSSETSVSSSSQDTTYNAEKNTLTDTRDGKVYRTVKIGNQVWMAENLNYAYTGVPYKYKDNTSDSTSWCYDNDPTNCTKYGRLYTWSAAMDSVGTWSANGKGCGYGVQCTPTYPVRGICPEGWHLPNDTEWDTLFVAVGGSEVAGNVLRSQTGWDNNGNGTDAFGFSALPAGYRYNYEGQFLYAGSEVHFWTSLDRHNEFVREMKLDVKKCVNWCQDDEDKSTAISVRCLKDDALVASSSSNSAKSSSSYSDGWSWDVPKDARLNPNIKYDSMVDPRDNQVYKVVKIEVPDSNYSQVWMAENLNYADSVKTPSLKGGNWCFNNDEKNCKVSGRYYSWAAAIDSVALANDAEAPLDCGYGKTCGLDRAVQGICPDGWHLPSIYEWGLLSVALGGAPVSGEPLKALTGWNYSSTGYNNGTDLYGFAALPTGRRVSATSWGKVGTDVYYWSATEQGAYYGRYFNINNVYTNSYTSQDNKYYGQSVRCVKGDPSAAPVRPSSSSSVDETKSSSSVTSVSSSSVVVAAPCKTETEDNCEYGTLTDSRDGQTYKTVEIGSQVWMAENLNYAYTGVLYNNSGYTSDSTSWCFGNDPANCIKYGRLYTWAAAMDSVGTWSTNGKDCGYGVQCTPIYPVRGICPEGWHLPDKAEWNTLFTAVGGASTAGKMLSSTISWSSVPGGWVRDGYGTDAYSFSALPAGLRNATGYNNVGYHAYFWSSSEYNSSRAYIVGLDDEFDKADLYGSGKDYGYSVRCVKD